MDRRVLNKMVNIQQLWNQSSLDPYILPKINCLREKKIKLSNDLVMKKPLKVTSYIGKVRLILCNNMVHRKGHTVSQHKKLFYPIYEKTFLMKSCNSDKYKWYEKRSWTQKICKHITQWKTFTGVKCCKLECDSTPKL